jgi:hypothetical protein
MLSLPVVTAAVRRAIQHTRDTSATGDDGIGPAFIKHADLGGTAHTPDHVLAPLLGRLFRAVLCSGHVPAAWKVARLTPLFKKGDRSDPSNYRLIAVSLVVYRLFAGVVNTLLTRWCQKENVFPKEQFGFSLVEAAKFVLRHLSQCQQCWGGSNKRLWIAFIDFEGAYDHVDREALWHHLQHVIGVPPQPLTVIQNMYSGDAYRLVDGLTSTAPISPSKGVKQGCSLSPILFALFLSDVGAALGIIQQGVWACLCRM